ncbi:hypothetical protein C8D87_107100 [Lentzea atacamensis]|uniref:Uncharacterized protein n=1 Tax=Lentzea atacamensis TaxID=531938 RepID=A0ABX9E4V1_9PSEU|nr:hypothetical protein [Lentzea atacamensis]RAS62952.1 hypothetical protein C8D87_107100 [Lentzea atacamensis]
MSHQLRNALDDVSKSMTGLRIAARGIPVHREGFKGLHDQFARSVATLTTHMSYARVLLDEDKADRRRGGGCSHAVFSVVGGPTLYDVQCEKCFQWWARETPHPPR